jgi:hypothetical protein
MTITATHVAYLEQMIKEMEPVNLCDILFSISCNDNLVGRATFESMQSGKNKSYYNIFSESGMGYSNYALYKSRNGNIYCIKLSYTPMRLEWCNQNGYRIVSYALVDDAESFMKI